MKTPKALVFMLLISASILSLVIATAYSRRSGNTGIDIAKIQQQRT